jgi:hypothetical protein
MRVGRTNKSLKYSKTACVISMLTHMLHGSRMIDETEFGSRSLNAVAFILWHMCHCHWYVPISGAYPVIQFSWSAI